MATQGPVQLGAETPLATNETVSNVAENQKNAENLRAANVDGKDIYPERVFTKDLALQTSLQVGSGVAIMDGTITSEMIGADQVQAVHIFAEGLQADQINFAGGGLSEFGIVTLGSIVGGSLSVGEGGVSIGGADGGFYIANHMLIAYSGATPTVTIDGSTGILTCTKLIATLDATSTLDTTLSSLTIGDDTVVNDGNGGTTVEAINTAATTAAAAVSDMASDGKVTPVEKLPLKAEWDRIQTEYSTLVSSASTQGVSSAALTTDYNALNTYLNTTLTVFTDMGSNTTVVRATWDATWKAYYDEATTLSTALSLDAERAAA